MDEQSHIVTDEVVNIEEIMRQIRKQILTEKAALSGEREPIVPADGERLPPEFYEHLYYAGVGYDQVGVKMHVTRVPLPIVGPLLEGIRGKIHAVVLFYVNQVVARQIQVNKHLLLAISILSQELEKGPEHT